MTAIKFGTDGWRGMIAEDFTFANARIVAQAIARYVVRGEDARKGVLIGYDHRFCIRHSRSRRLRKLSVPRERPSGSPTSLAPHRPSVFSCAREPPRAESLSLPATIRIAGTA